MPLGVHFYTRTSIRERDPESQKPPEEPPHASNESLFGDNGGVLKPNPHRPKNLGLRPRGGLWIGGGLVKFGARLPKLPKPQHPNEINVISGPLGVQRWLPAPIIDQEPQRSVVMRRNAVELDTRIKSIELSREVPQDELIQTVRDAEDCYEEQPDLLRRALDQCDLLPISSLVHLINSSLRKFFPQLPPNPRQPAPYPSFEPILLLKTLQHMLKYRPPNDRCTSGEAEAAWRCLASVDRALTAAKGRAPRRDDIGTAHWDRYAREVEARTRLGSMRLDPKLRDRADYLELRANYVFSSEDENSWDESEP